MNVLILGNGKDGTAAHLHRALSEAGATVDYLDTRFFPTKLRMCWEPSAGVGYLTLPGGRRMNLEDIHSVFWRTLGEIYVPDLEDPHQQRVAYNDGMSMLRSLIQLCPARWINSWDAYQFHKEKPRQLTRAQQLGVTIPATAIGNDPQAVIEFVQWRERVIFKPVYGGAHTQLVSPAHLEPERLNSVLSLAPVTLQEYIPGTNIRSYVIGDAVYSAEIRSPSVDFREDKEAQLIPVEVPEMIREQSVAITRAFMMEWTAIDWRLTPRGEYYFLEANPSPMFVHFENQTDYPITRDLVNLLMQ
ncbi:hypothetical protein [Phormidium sp. CCY1219]|uniref:hypothetical protein n=1 Tax=Phormidium sp. CCY1219 TaxID=2886104 RepID=UPI002D1F8397|nr:hypothetical protein [Phormidium sp. CCY1219]MEB3830509.1 hypothetical protein [Phormidium sp. CCY1219]